MKYFLINMNYIVPLEIVVEVAPEHRAYLKAQFEAGRLLFSSARVPRTAGVLLARAEDISTIYEMIEGDPFKTEGIGEFEVVEITPILWAEELSKVFGKREE